MILGEIAGGGGPGTLSDMQGYEGVKSYTGHCYELRIL